jgi:hypothetical protein
MRLFAESMIIYAAAWFGAFSPAGRRVAPLTPRRLVCLSLFPLFLGLQLLHWLCLALDHLVFPAFRRQSIERPVFVLGVPRSGTTFLHRSLAADPAFTTTRTWELLLAPSLCQRYLIRILVALDRRCGGPLHSVLGWLVHRAAARLDDIHPVGLDAAEEDYLALLPAAGCFFASLAFPASPGLAALGDITTLPEARRRRLLDHYHRLLQRHVFAHGGRQLLSKNAAFASWGDDLMHRFPGATALVCIRDPLHAVSSQVSALQAARTTFAIDPAGTELPRVFREHYRAWFVHLEAFARHYQPLVIEQTWMAGHGDEALDRVYQRLGRARPRGADCHEARSTTGHRHRPADFGLDRDMLGSRLWGAYTALARRAALQQ